MEEEAPKEIITPEQLRRALREAARNDEVRARAVFTDDLTTDVYLSRLLEVDRSS